MSNDAKYCMSLLSLCIVVGVYWIYMKSPKKIRKKFEGKTDESTIVTMQRLSIVGIIFIMILCMMLLFGFLYFL